MNRILNIRKILTLCGRIDPISEDGNFKVRCMFLLLFRGLSTSITKCKPETSFYNLN